MASDMDLRFNQVDVQLVAISGDVKQVESDLLDLQGDVSLLESQMLASFNASALQALTQDLNGDLHYKERLGIPLTYSMYGEFENHFYTWAVSTSGDDNHEPISARSFDDDKVAMELRYSPDQNIAYFFQYLATKMPNAGVALPGKVPNPRDWAIAASAYAELSSEWPDFAKKIAKSRRNDVIKMGQGVESLLQSLASQQGQKILQALLENYTQKWMALSGQITQYETMFKRNLHPDPTVQDYNAALNLWGGGNQMTKYVPAISSIDKVPGFPASVAFPNYSPAPNNMGAILPNACRLAQQLGLGTASIVSNGGLTNTSSRQQKRTQGRSTWTDTYAVEAMSFGVAFTGVSPGIIVDEWWVPAASETLVETCYANCSPITYLLNFVDWTNNNWQSGQQMLNRFVPNGTLLTTMQTNNPGLAAQVQGHANVAVPFYQQQQQAIIAKSTAYLQNQQRTLYTDVAQEVHSGSMQMAAADLSGAKELLVLYATLAFPTSMSGDDYARSLLFGNNAVLDGDAVAALYSESVNAGKDGMDLTRVNADQTANSRLSALGTRLNAFLNLASSGKQRETYTILERALSELGRP
jgi:hypothetical protein